MTRASLLALNIWKFWSKSCCKWLYSKYFAPLINLICTYTVMIEKGGTMIIYYSIPGLVPGNWTKALASIKFINLNQCKILIRSTKQYLENMCVTHWRILCQSHSLHCRWLLTDFHYSPMSFNTTLDIHARMQQRLAISNKANSFHSEPG